MSRRNRLRTSFGNEVHQGAWPHHVLIFRLYNKLKFQYRAFCAGSIIGEKRVLTSTNCFFTNRKNPRHKFDQVRFVAGILKTRGTEPIHDDIEQWRKLERVYTQKFYRFPAFNLAVVVLTKPWVFNTYVNKIPYATKEQDFDGVCTATAVKATRSWSTIKYLYTQEVEMVPREECEKILCRSCRLFMCTVFNNRNQYAYSETEGGGLVCYETGDPAEVDINQGVLVAVTSIVNIGLPNLNMRVGLFSQWVTDVSCDVYVNKFVMVLCILMLCY
ncbi:hypothetical protein HW555_003621 [Spodoptera exigua]|uniref:Peptidase S1 domain-containing protein n=1 Tax=Spodoptera exigua TaxID=7107 RepID=A0A835GPT5_SPOEX|nr:hypothetical protein HW555_003621 [Spodoptera exigua]